ncbi:phosphate signaling complex protein PhoU [Thermoleophilia bacterium SCSIO 60948]|nr:phosphate signaling complex protein PhoU [Thermoleophilia bacterium SCSIO 60948]
MSARARETRAGADHVRQEYERQLAALEASALEALDFVVTAIERTTEAIEHRDIELAEMVVADDDIIDGRYLEVHQRLLTMLATQAPVAGDLRVIAALLHLMKNVERMGDQCVNIAKILPLSGHDSPSDERIVANLVKMGQQVKILIRQAKRAFADRDIDLAQSLVVSDDVVDTLNRQTFRLAIEVGDDPDIREWATTMILVARALERVGDNAVDIGEQVAFVVTGLFREFQDASDPAARISRL